MSRGHGSAPRFGGRGRAAGSAVLAACGMLAALVLGGCGEGGSSSSPVIVATAPPGGGLDTGSATGTGSGSGSTTAQTGGVRTVIATLGLNLRDQPSTSGKVVGTLGQGTVLQVLGYTDQGGGWYQVRGETTTGFISADPRYSSPRRFQAFGSAQHGFSLLYPDSWTFSDSGGASVVFTPQQATGQRLVVAAAATLDALGAPGRAGYSVSSGDTVEVFGVTGTVRTFDRGQGAPAGTTAPLGSTPAPPTSAASSSPAGGLSPDTAPHLAEIRLTVNKQTAFRIDFDYQSPSDLDLFRDIYNSMKIFAALPTASPSPGQATSTTT